MNRVMFSEPSQVLVANNPAAMTLLVSVMDSDAIAEDVL